MTILYSFLSRDEDIFLTRAATDIIKFYGIGHQTIKLEEECAELIAAIARFNGDGDPCEEHAEQILEELADVILVTEQIVGAMSAKTGRRLANIVMAKADRQLQRISKEKEEKHA